MTKTYAELEAEVSRLTRQVQEHLAVCSTPLRRPAPASECSCLYVDRPEFHDWLIGLEQRGWHGVAELIQAWEGRTDGCVSPTDGPLEEPLEVTSFVAQHDWADSWAVHRVADFINRAESARGDFAARRRAGVLPNRKARP